MKKFLLGLLFLAFSFFSYAQPNTYPASGFSYQQGTRWLPPTANPTWGYAEGSIVALNRFDFKLNGSATVWSATTNNFDLNVPISSYVWGGYFGNSNGGYAITTTSGHNWFNYIAGTHSLFGYNAASVYDGLSLVYIKGRVHADTIHTSSGNVGDVLTKAADGNYYPLPVPSNATSGTYTPIISTTTGITSWNSYADGLGGFQPATWFRVGNVVTVDFPIAFKFPVPSAYATFRITLPIPTITLATQTLALTGLLDAGNSAITFGGTTGSTTYINAVILLPSTIVPTSFYSAKLHIVYRVQ